MSSRSEIDFRPAAPCAATKPLRELLVRELRDLLSAEKQILKALPKMIKAAKKRGYVTMDELNSVLPSEEVTSEQIEDTMAMLSDMGINVIEDEDAEEAAQTEDEGGDDDNESEGGELASSGGTALATVKLVEQAGGEVVGLRFAIELSSEFDGRTPLAGYDVQSVMQY